MRDIFMYQIYTNLVYVPTTYRRLKKLRVIMINKDVRKYLARKNGNKNPIWSWNDSLAFIPQRENLNASFASDKQ